MTQPEALRLAEWLEGDGGGLTTLGDCAAELRRLSAVEAELLAMRRVFSEAGCTFDVNYIRRLVRAEAQRIALLEAIKPMIDLAEVWINHGQKGHMCEQEFKVWLALGHESDAMRNARAAIKQAEGENT